LFHFSYRTACLAAVLGILASAGGCASWDLDRFNPENYRDSRALDIENRLEDTKPIVANPF
jgi:hypothetical protein